MHAAAALLLVIALTGCGSTIASDTGSQLKATSTPDSLTRVVLEGDEAPAEVRGTFERIDASSVDDADTVAFAATLSGSAAESGIFLASKGTVRAIVVSGQAAPGGGTFDAFREVDIALLSPAIPSQQEDFVVFSATLSETNSSEGVFSWRGGHVEALARSGDRSPRGKEYEAFSSVTVGSGHLEQPLYQYAFVAHMKDGAKSAVIYASWDGLGEPLTTGDLIGKKADQKVEDFTISRMGYSLGCVAQVRKVHQKRSFKKVLIVHRGFALTGNVIKEGARFDLLGKLVEISPSVGCNWQQAYVALRFGSGESALARRDVDGNADVFARSTDPGVELPAGETLIAFDGPLANAIWVNDSQTFAVVSRVTLSSGRTALWARYFPYANPLPVGSTRLILLGGAAVVGGQEITLHDVAPAKITDLFTILVTGTVGEGSETRHGLFLAPTVFIDATQ